MLAVDPGPTQSAWIAWNDGQIVGMEIELNQELRQRLMWPHTWLDAGHPLVIEWIESYGMAIGKDVFETVYWIGRFTEAAGESVRIPRREVKMHLCGNNRATDANIRQALIDRFGGSEGRKVAVGTKRDKGPLYGVRKDLWAALALAVTYEDINKGAFEDRQ